MKNCRDYPEIISAYLDGELSEDDMRSVDEHLAACESCSAILEFYREISAASDESMITPPESLASGVMDRILNGDIKAEKTETKTRSVPLRHIFTRYAPVAACLAVILLAIPMINSYRTGQSDMLQPLLTTLRSTNFSNDMAEPRPAYDQAPREMNAAAPAAPAPGGMSESETYDEYAGGGSLSDTDDPESDYFKYANDPAGRVPILPEATDAPQSQELTMPAERADSLMPAPPDASPPALSDGEGAEGSAGFTDLITDDENKSFFDPADSSPQAAASILAYIGKAYACITFTGELPALLTGYKSDLFGGWMNWEMFFEIPLSLMPELMDELSGDSYHNVEVLLSEADSDYVIIMYSSAG